MSGDRGDRKTRTSALLVVALAIAFSYFHQGEGWNQNSRFDLVRAIVEDHSLSIDGPCGHVAGRLPATCRNTGDFAVRNGRLYSDKAPGVSMLAVPFVAVAWPLARAAGIDPSSRKGSTAMAWLATVFAVALPTALSVLAFLWVARRFGAGGEVFAALVLGLGTPMWAYATILWGHALAASCLVVGFAAAWATGTPGSKRRDALLGLSVGCASGWATVTEFPAVIPAAILAGFAVASAWPRGRPVAVRVGGGVLLGAAACAAVLVAYQLAAFGSVFQLGYASVAGFEGMKTGFLGLSHPRATVVGKILFGEFRGLLPLAPVLAAAPVGYFLLLRAPGTRLAAGVGATIAVYYVLLNASYFYWTGGWSYGPRHMAPALPFLCLGLAPVWARARAAVRALLLLLAVIGGVEALAAVSAHAFPPDSVLEPMRELILPAFFRGDLALGAQSFEGSALVSRPGATNLGMVLGLGGHGSLLPLAAAWAVLAAAIMIRRRR